MKRGFIFIAFIALFSSMIWGCGSVPETYYYLPTYQIAPPANDHTPLDVVLGIEKFQAEIIYNDDRIIYRDSPFEVKYYNYRRWIAEYACRWTKRSEQLVAGRIVCVLDDFRIQLDGDSPSPAGGR